MWKPRFTDLQCRLVCKQMGVVSLPSDRITKGRAQLVPSPLWYECLFHPDVTVAWAPERHERALTATHAGGEVHDSGSALTWRARAQIPFDATVRVSLDTNLTMIKENPDDGPSCTVAGRCGFGVTLCLCCVSL